MCFRKKRTKSKTNQQHQFPISSSEDVKKKIKYFIFEIWAFYYIFI